MTLDRDVELIQFAYPQIYYACHTRHVRRRSSAVHLSARDSEILVHLDRASPTSLSVLARHMDLAASTLSEAISSLGAIGYSAVELMADLHHAWPPTFDVRRRAETKRQLADLGMVVSNVNAFTCFVQGDTYHPTWIETDPKQLQIRIDHTNRSLELAAEFGVKTVSIQPGAIALTWML